MESAMQCWHLTFSADSRFPPFPSESRRRLAIRKLVQVAGNEMVLFCVVDEHIHLVVCCSRQRAGLIGRSVLRALNPISDVPLELGDLREVQGRSHLERLVRYHLRQVLHHDVPGADPALWSGSCFQDMVNARVIEGLQLRLWEALPRLRLRVAYQHVGLPQKPIEPLDDAGVRAAGATRIVSATSAALAANERLDGDGAAEVLGRKAAVQLTRVTGMQMGEIAWALDVTTRAVRRLLEPDVAEPITRAVRIRLALEDMVQALSCHARLQLLRGRCQEESDAKPMIRS
jgi:hypothetical protein